MSIAITQDHRALAETAANLLQARDARGAARKLLDAPMEGQPDLWRDIADLGWLGLHVPEVLGGSGYGMEELVVVVEELGRALAPGAFVPTVIASAVIIASGHDAAMKSMVPGLADGTQSAAVALGSELEVRDGEAYGLAGVALGAGIADLLLAASGDDVVIIDLLGKGVEVAVLQNIDPTRRAAKVKVTGAPVTVLVGARAALVDTVHLVLGAEAVGVARACTEQAVEYAKVRQQFGRPIAMFQAVKHHCANMLVAVELATAAVWDAARAYASGGDARGFTSAVAATLAAPAADLCANLNIQVHGGIGITWEHDAHMYLRRATALKALLAPDEAAARATALTRAGVERKATVDLPPEADAFRSEVRTFVEGITNLDTAGRRAAMIETGYVMPHWPKPWGRQADAVEQLVIEQEFGDAGIRRPSYSITGWIMLTLIQHATEDQVARWVRAALDQEVVWCQLFSEPDAGSDAAGITTKGKRVDGGWLVNGQKVWTSGAHLAELGLATVRTDPDAPKHNGITTMVIEMRAAGVEVRPLRMTNGESGFNEVFFNDVFVPDDDVIGTIDNGWTVARATLGNESVSLGGSQADPFGLSANRLVELFDASPERLAGGAARIGRHLASSQAVGLINLRNTHRALAGEGPSPVGNVTKLVSSELGHDAAGILLDLAGPDGVFMEDSGAISGPMVLIHRAGSIAGGTSEIKRNQIGERILGLPRDPLLK